MVQCSIIVVSSPFYKQLVGFILIFSSIYVSESFETCGIFLTDFQPIPKGQSGIVHEIIEYFHLKQEVSTSFIIKNKLAQREILPDIFRSMKYDCFLHVHINFGKDLFSTIPPFETPQKCALYQKAMFLIVVRSEFRDIINYKTWFANFDREYRIFVSKIEMAPHYNQRREEQFVFYRTYFFCSFCKLCFIRVNTMNLNYLSMTLSSVEKYWDPIYAIHYYTANSKFQAKIDKFCRLKNAMYLYGVSHECASYVVLIQLIAYASGHNFTLKPHFSLYYDFDKIPQIFENDQYNGFEKSSKYSSPMLKTYQYPSIIYCFNLGRQTIAEANMWTKYVPGDV